MPSGAKQRLGGQRPAGAFTADVKRDALFFKERERVRQANDEKTKALRALRLAKEAAEALAKAAAPDAPKTGRS